MDRPDMFLTRDMSSNRDMSLSGKMGDYRTQVEQIIAWLTGKETDLNTREDQSELEKLNNTLILEEYKIHDKFVTELCEFCHVIMQCREEGQEMLDCSEDLSDEDRLEIEAQMDKMTDLHEELKKRSAMRLCSLQEIIRERQTANMMLLEEMLSVIEKKIANSSNIGPEYDAIQRQKRDLDILDKELPQIQELLNFISVIVDFDVVDQQSLQFRSRSSESIDDRMTTLNERWEKICRFVDERNTKLNLAESIWKRLVDEGSQLSVWLSEIERNLDEVSLVMNNLTEEPGESFVLKLTKRLTKIDQEIKNIEPFYTSLESKVELDFRTLEGDDSCSMLLVVLGKKLEDLQADWEAIHKRKRHLVRDLQNPRIDQVDRIMIPLPDPINNSQDNLRFNGATNLREQVQPIQEHSNNLSPLKNDANIRANGISGTISDPRAFDNSLSSDNTSMYGNIHNRQPYNEDFNPGDEISSSSMTASYPIDMLSPNEVSSYSPTGTSMIKSQEKKNFHSCNDLPASNSFSDHQQNHNCRVEDWKHGLESFSTWLKQVEVSLGIEESIESVDDPIHSRATKPWSKLDLNKQVCLLIDIENRINSTCQYEFDRLIREGQQIIEDLIPEISENEYEANLKVILADLDARYSSVKSFLNMRIRELTNMDRWRELVRKLRSICDYLINRMGEVVPESNIGVDLITLAQQQDQLIQCKADLKDNVMVQSVIQDTKLFLYVCENLQQHYDQHIPSNSNDNVGDLANREYRAYGGTVDMWLSFKDLKEDVEDLLDRLTLHNSELSQLIDDRLARLDEVHKEMHAIQHKMQELATELQVAEILKSSWVPLDGLDVEKLSEQLEDLKLYRERISEIESTHKVMNSVFEWMTQSDVPLSQQNLKRLDELNTIWGQILASVEERQKQIELAFDNQGATEQKFLEETVADLPRWQRKVAPTKIPYFVDHETNKTIWDHPKFTDLLNDLTGVKQYVFSAYRTALKLKMVQRRLGICMLMLEKLKDVFEAIDLQLAQEAQSMNSSGTNQMINNSGGVTLIGVEHLIIYLKAIYERIQSEEDPSLNVPLSIDLTLNWLLNLYDSTRTGYISNLSLKIGLALICCATREEKYMFMYELVSNRVTGTVDARKLGTLAEICMRIPIYLGEGESFGGAEIVESSVRDCFSMSKYNPSHPNCIDMTDFISWLKTEPQFIIWLPVLHRILISERTTHQVKCKLCGTKPIVGLRYRCLRCFKYNICQHCFLTGRQIYEHPDPSVHLMQEYCSKTSSGENVRDLTKILRNKIVPRSKSSETIK